MSAAVGAALKKVLVAILTEPKVLKNILFAILVVVVAMILPTVFVVSIFSGDFEVDTASLQQYVEDNLSAADIVLLTNVENTMEAIEEAMIEAELGSEARTAQVLYVLALSDYASQPGFVSRLVSCFRPEQTDSQLSAAVGAALKKVLVAILTEPKVLKNILFAILVVVVAMILPTVFVVSIFSGDFEVDTASLQQYVEDNLSAADIVLLTNVENTMEAIEEAMIEAELGSEARTAQVLYVLALSDYASQPGFVSRLVSCFRPEQTDSQLVNAVNAEFGTNIQLQDFSNVMRNIRSRQINTSTYTDPGTKNNLDLVEWAIAAYNADWGYVMGTYGLVLTEDLLEAKLIQLPDDVGPYEEFIRSNYLGLRTADCVGLIKGYSWYDVDTGEIGYATNGHPDVGADQLYNNATEKGPISTLPEIPGLILHAEGHVGIYIGGGYAIEAMGTRYGVVKTRVANRNWTGWCKSPYIAYVEEAPEEQEPV